MLSNELMGLLALGILWVNTLLVVAAAMTPLMLLVARARRKLQKGRVVAGSNGGVLASYSVEQVGRRAADDAARQAILFHDRAYASDVAGGALEVAGASIGIDHKQPAEVWMSVQEKHDAAECTDFDDAYRASKRAKGYVRELRCSLREDQVVWFAAATSKAPTLLSSFDPRPWLRRRIATVVAFQVTVLALSTLATWLGLHAPLFGTMSVIGGVLGLVHFLGIMLPFGVVLREASRLPHEAIVRGSWVKPGSESAGVTTDFDEQTV